MKEKPRVLVSLCLLGVDCRYDGGSMRAEGIERLMSLCEPVPVCPEQLGGLPTPRVPSERREGRVYARDGADVTAAFERGATQVCRIAELFGARLALLKARSPSCGVDGIYDGTFTGRIVPGRGTAAEALAAMGVRLYTEDDIPELIRSLENER